MQLEYFIFLTELMTQTNSQRTDTVHRQEHLFILIIESGLVECNTELAVNGGKDTLHLSECEHTAE